MTTSDRLPVPAPTVIDAVPVNVSDRRYVTNPHLFSAVASGVLVLGTAAGLGWSMYRGYDHAGLVFCLLLATLCVLVHHLRRFNDWDQA